ncbi:N(4)-(beta-N-acetylglucosaminyl)-L-asparaginase [Candidatus Bathyarchaeota archaeon]|nr:N(4)-(beta-N-acetylglucosaminyl)-L-asparaginase [Candidatus Bathyarchaeota archaeon]MBS7630856.1 N(4)-(beta-N-acetylglucosaminyl)-L-asparaginase [Candidatus Bathyarchaeota archaeon]
MVKPFIIGTVNARDFLHIGKEILRRGGSALDAVEATVNAVENNPMDTSVGLGGIPNMLGVVQLDASIMDGRTLKTGAVAAVENYVNVISIARKVMENSPHVLLVGKGAELFAEMMGFKKSELLTEKSRTIYKAFLEDSLDKLDERFSEKGYIIDYIKNFDLREWYSKLADDYHGTVNVMAMDDRGDVCSGVSTSGTALKFPGRVGDSPIIGAGNYCDNRVGAAACTGRGELAIRLSTARTIVSYMDNGLKVKDACIKAMRDINSLKELGGMNCLAFDKHGETFSASTTRVSVHYYMDVDSDEPEERQGETVRD